MTNDWPPFATQYEEHEVPGRNLEPLRYSVPFRIPNLIAEAECPKFSPSTQDLIIKAEASLPVASEHRGHGGFVEGLLLRNEALGSSHIENNPTSYRQLTLTEAGATAKEWNREAVRNLWVMRGILEDAPRTDISKSVILNDQNLLLGDKKGAGNFRTEGISRIGDSIIDSPVVFPPNGQVEHFVADWLRFAARSDFPFIPQIALGHAHFVSIHPFGDGNGRTGRAAIQRMLLLRGYRTLPVSVALFALREKYFEALGAYRDGDQDPIVRILSLAILSASTAISKHIPEVETLVESWKINAGATTQSKQNIARALEWAAGTPAFTTTKLSEGIGVSTRTAQRIVVELSDLGVLSSSKKTHPQKETKRVVPIYEAREITELAEKIEATAKEYALSWWESGNAAYSADNGKGRVSETIPVLTIQNIARKVREEGSHPVLCRSAGNGYGLGASLFEVFVFHNGQLVMRADREDTMIAGRGSWERINVFVGSTSRLQIDVDEANIEDVEKFAALTGQSNLLPDRGIRAFWENIKKEFQDILRTWYVWQFIGKYDKFPGPRLMEMGFTPEYQRLLGRSAGIIFYQNLSSFFKQEHPREYYVQLREGQLWQGYSPSLFSAVEVLLEYADIPLPYYDTNTCMGQEQRTILTEVQTDLKSYKNSRGFHNLAKFKKSDVENWEANWYELTEEQFVKSESKYPTERLIADYLNISAGVRSQNRDMLDAEEVFLIKAVEIASTRGIASIEEETIKRIFGFLKRIETEVFGMRVAALDEWKQKCEISALEEATTIAHAILGYEVQKAESNITEGTEHFRKRIASSPAEHQCVPSSDPRQHSIETEASKIFFRRCRDCGGNIRLLDIETGASVSAQSSEGRSILSIQPDRCLIQEGHYGRTTVKIFCEDKNALHNILEKTYQVEGGVKIEITTRGELVWEGMCSREPAGVLDSVSFRCHDSFALNI